MNAQKDRDIGISDDIMYVSDDAFDVWSLLSVY
jgi:hypothetical protein